MKHELIGSCFYHIIIIAPTTTPCPSIAETQKLCQPVKHTETKGTLRQDESKHSMLTDACLFNLSLYF